MNQVMYVDLTLIETICPSTAGRGQGVGFCIYRSNRTVKTIHATQCREKKALLSGLFP
jgi:hypothetical protein